MAAIRRVGVRNAQIEVIAAVGVAVVDAVYAFGRAPVALKLLVAYGVAAQCYGVSFE